MAKYEMQEMNLPNEEGKRVLYPRLMLGKRVETGYIAKMLAQRTTFSAAEVVGLLMGLADQISDQMAQGRPVRLEGIGTFTPGLTLCEGKGRESGEENDARRNAQSVEIGKILFRPDKSFLQRTNRECDLERSKLKFQRSSKKYTPEQRLELALRYLDSHPYMRIADYVAITGLRPTTASLELKKWAKQPDSGIGFSGWGTHKVYVRMDSQQ